MMSRRANREIPQLENDSIVAVKGKIKSVYCKNFVTYGECTFHPTEYLNVIIGPNGTGKSTLVAAIVLGLGGKPELLSRSSSIGDYVKNGRDEAMIRVEIFRETYNKSTIFQRCFPRSGKSTYKIGEDTVSERNYLAAIMEFKIQIGNLCQFLPQDRVQDFAKMDPQKIFFNTINSVCSTETLNTFDELKKLRLNQTNEADGVRKKKEELEQLQAQCHILCQRLERFNEQQEYQNKLDVCHAKKLQLEVRALDEKKKQETKDLLLAKTKLEEEQKKYDIIIRRQHDISKTSQQLAKDIASKEREEQTVIAKKQRIEEQIKILKDRIEQARTTYLKKKREKADYDNELQNETRILRLFLDDLTKAKENIDADKDWKSEKLALTQKLQRLKEELAGYMKTRSEINSKLDEQYTPDIGLLTRRLERANDVHAQKLQLIREKYPEVYRGVQWLNDHKDLFQGRVYNPMILELSVRDPAHAKYFENTISIRDLLAFTCENKEDVSLLVNELCVKQKLQVSVGHAPPASKINYRADVSIDSLRSCGFTAYLIDLIDGPPAIINYLCNLNGIHRIPIGSSAVNEKADDVPNNINFFFGGDQLYSVKVSRYSGEKSILQNQIIGKNLLTSRNTNQILEDENRLRVLKRGSDALKNQRTALENKIEETNVKREEVMARNRTIEGKIAERGQLEEKCRRQNDKVKQLKNNVINLPELEKTFSEKVKSCLQEIMQLQSEKIEILKSLQQALLNKKFAVMKERIFKQENEELINTIRETTDSKAQASRMVETITRTMEKTTQLLDSKTAEARKAKRECKSLELFNQLPDTMDELKEAINEFKARLECMGDVDKNIVAEYKQKCADIEKLKEEMQNSEHNRQDIATKIRTLHDGWYPEIEGIVTTLNIHFSDFMTSMGYVGEVNLVRREEFDYDTYGIQIMVQYRSNAQLQALDRHTQSGGERAVAIATYTLSLQHITHVPFRCVDEINQGMDANNERKIFEMLVKETTQTGRAQYFFVTPKLLPNLLYNERMSVHIVFNGKMVKSPNAFAFQM
ncbi:PREDICTED: structural maintenance of chromosomes protein 5 [Rhagoletis zephyria]|uniref:structural maintenance of chromosomes protein 5 n=1 Tax=Rhagoletis zephyria TaxID=28612 RepID=UPI0008118451|nr:PREDICTED: structural maintenance of chromosomes protein 5 [Rhagoletis zephyria]